MAFTVTDNSPSIGYIAWSDLNIQFEGVSYAIADGNTNQKFAYWDKSASTTTLQTSNTLPTLTDEDVIIFLNKSGTAITVPHVRGVIEGDLIIDGTILADAIATNAITSDKVLAGAIVANKLGANAVIAGNIAAGAVQAGNIAADAVQAGNIDADAVTAREIQAGTITANEIGAGAITADEIGAGAIVVSAIADGAITADAISAGAIDDLGLQSSTPTDTVRALELDGTGDYLSSSDPNTQEQLGAIVGLGGGLFKGFAADTSDAVRLDDITASATLICCASSHIDWDAPPAHAYLNGIIASAGTSGMILGQLSSGGGELTFSIRDSSGTNRSAGSTGFSGSGVMWVAAVFDEVAGTVSFYESTNAPDDHPGTDPTGGDWSLVTANVAVGYYNGTPNGGAYDWLTVGAHNSGVNQSWRGSIYRAQMWIDGALVQDVNPDDETDGSTSFVAGDGYTYNATGDAVVKHLNRVSSDVSLGWIEGDGSSNIYAKSTGMTNANTVGTSLRMEGLFQFDDVIPAGGTEWLMGGSGNEFLLLLNAAGKLYLALDMVDGGSGGADRIVTSTDVLATEASLSDGDACWVAVEWTASSGATRWYYSTDTDTRDPAAVSWTEFSTKTDTTAAIGSDTIKSDVGMKVGNTSQPLYQFNGKVFVVRCFFDGRVVAYTDLFADADGGDSSWTGSDGLAWTATGDTVTHGVGSLDWRVLVAHDDWTPASNQYVVAHRESSVVGSSMRLITNGSIGILATVTTGDNVSQSGTALGITNGVARWCRLTRDWATGDIAYYDSGDISVAHNLVSWTAKGTDSDVAGPLVSTADAWSIGARGDGGAPMAGKVYAVAYLNATTPDGTAVPVMTPDFRGQRFA